MYEILEQRMLNANISLMVVKAPRVAASCLPGQFLIVRKDEEGERIPLTICDYDREKETVTLCIQAVGASSEEMIHMKKGDAFLDVVGPLGNASELVTDIDVIKGKRILFVAGGVGTAPVYPQAKYLHEKGIDVDVIIGAKTKDILIMEDEMRAAASNVYIATDDGSYGFKGMVTNLIEDLIAKGNRYDVCVAIGPLIMMKFVCLTTKKYDLKTIVSMNPIMVDGTGMCGACRLLVNNEVKFACVDGPEFDGHLVDFDGAMNRQSLYKTEEGRALLKLREGDTHHGGCGMCGGEK